MTLEELLMSPLGVLASLYNGTVTAGILTFDDRKLGQDFVKIEVQRPSPDIGKGQVIFKWNGIDLVVEERGNHIYIPLNTNPTKVIWFAEYLKTIDVELSRQVRREVEDHERMPNTAR